jgi:hypothetical protein
MSNDKPYAVIMEVPSKNQELKSILIEAGITALRDGCNHILNRISTSNDSNNPSLLTSPQRQVQVDPSRPSQEGDVLEGE